MIAAEYTVQVVSDALDAHARRTLVEHFFMLMPRADTRVVFAGPSVTVATYSMPGRVVTIRIIDRNYDEDITFGPADILYINVTDEEAEPPAPRRRRTRARKATHADKTAQADDLDRTIRVVGNIKKLAMGALVLRSDTIPALWCDATDEPLIGYHPVSNMPCADWMSHINAHFDVPFDADRHVTDARPL